jgi:hypothetical protein
MTDQHPGYREDWDITSEAGSLCFASAIYSRLVGGEQDEATFQWLAKYLRANAAPQHISAMTDQHQHRASINLNDDVKVKLTDYGRDLLAKKRLTRQPDEAGYIKFQLWELMNIFGSYVCNGCSIPCNGCSIPFTFNRILLAPFDSAMTDQHQHRATPEQWAKVKGYAPGLEVCSCLIELRDRIQLLEATQHAHIEAKASEAGARCAVEQLRSKPGSWQPIKTETTYGSDAAIPELSEHRAPDEWLLHSYKVGPAEPVEDWGKGFTQVRTPDPAAGAQVGRSSAAVDRVLALQDQIRDGSLTLPEALKKINGDDQPVQQFIAKYLFTAGNIQQDSFCYDPSDSNSVSFDIAKFEPVNGCLKPGDGIKIAHRWGELPASDVYSTINYKVVSVSETENRAWTIRAVRVGTSDSEPAPTADDLDAVAAAGAQVGRSSAAVDQVLALQDQIRDGSLSLADALKEIGASEPAKDPFRRPSLADTLADTHHCSFFNTSVLIRAFKDWLTQEGKAPLAMRELLEAQAQIAESDPHA